MKNLIHILVSISLLLTTACIEKNVSTAESEKSQLQEEKRDDKTTKTEKTKTKKETPMNLLDEQAKMYSNIFGDFGGVTELQGIEGFMDMVEKTDVPPEVKKQLTEQYELYNNSLDPEKKELVKAQLNKMLLEAINKSK